MSKSRTVPWLAIVLAAVGLLVVAIPGLWVYVNATATPLHPNPRDAPSVSHSAPLPKLAGAVEQGRQLARASLTGQNLPGLSVAVGIGGDIVWAEGFGFADLKTSVPVTPNHRFRIGTASAVLTSVAAGLLLEDGRLKLGDRIQTYVPEFPKKQWPVTLGQLMGHTAGVINDGGDEGPLFNKQCRRPVDALPHFAEHSLLFEPGTQYRYSSYGWILVSAAIEAATEQPFLTFMRERVFDPLGMRDTGPDPAVIEEGEDFPLVNMVRELIHDPEATRDKSADSTKKPDSASKPGGDRATFYFPRFAADPTYGLHLMRPLNLSCYAGSSVFLSTPSDLVRFGMAINSGKLLKPATVQLLQTSQRLASGKESGYGLGWDLETATLAGKQSRAAGHDGETLGGMVTSLMTFPEHGIVVSVTSNISYADTYSLAVSIAQAFAEHGRAPAHK
jgi:serine beta-lactamase-like protein LACTB, mitochondrial